MKFQFGYVEQISESQFDNQEFDKFAACIIRMSTFLLPEFVEMYKTNVTYFIDKVKT